MNYVHSVILVYFQKSAWSLLASVLIFLIVFNSTTAAVSPGIHNTQSCPSTCNCLEDKMTCNGVIPDYTPETVRSLVLAEVDSREFYATRFCYVSWKNITDINIKDVRFSGKSFNLSGMVFDCLVNIISFKFSSQFLAHFTIDTFFGLKNVRVFDLSDCPLTDWQDLYETLSVRTNMPKITQLLLSNSGVHSYLYINQAFVNVLSYRPLACIDLSFTRFIMDFSEPGMLCKTLKSFKYASSDHTGSKTFKHSRICDSLRTIDESNDNYYKRRFHNFACINRLLMFAFPSPFFWNTRVIRSSGSITSSEKFLVSNCTIVLWIESQLLELYFSHNYLPDLDARLYNTRLEILSLSHCQIESINSDAFRYLGSLHTLDLSNNCLFKMEGRNNSLSVLFKHNNNLKVIYLSGNKLTHLPSETFISNVNLRELNLPVNSLKQITFNISQLLNLTVLDLRNNSIRSLNEPSRIHLDSLYNKQRIRYKTSHNRSVLQVFLEGNPFSCDCTSKEFLQWFVTSPLFFATRQNHYCKLDGRDIQMTEAAIDAAKNDCSRAKRRKLIELLSSTLLSTCFVVCIITTIILYKRRIKKLKERRFQGGIQRLAENRSRFPVFLSYSSDDSDFVKLHLLPQFQVFMFDKKIDILHMHMLKLFK